MSGFRSDVNRIRVQALAYPETREDFPWGHSAFKVKEKVFLFMGCEADELSLSVKLPQSKTAALKLEYTEPTHYGLGKHGWVSAKFGPGDDVPLDLIAGWIEESFRAVAPKKLVADHFSESGAEPKAKAKAPLKQRRARR